MRHGRLLLTSLAALCGTAGVTAGAAVGQGAPTPLLPDLVQELPDQVQVKVVRGRELLAFRSAVSNRGDGPLMVEGSRRSRRQKAMTGAQVVLRSDGRRVRRPAVGTMRYTRASGHVHWHLQGFDRYELRSAADGRLARPDQKTGFCLGDRYQTDNGPLQPGEPVIPAYPGHCGLRRPDLLRVTQGISVGYGDSYVPYLEGQSIDVTGVPDGAYDLVHRVNADGRLLEKDPSNNTACVGLTLSRTSGRPAVATTSCHNPSTTPPNQQEVGS